MSKKILVIAPHPDDETLGCGGTILRHIANSDEVHWLLVTGIRAEEGFSQERMEQREQEINIVAQKYGFASVKKLQYPTTKLDNIPMAELIQKFGAVIKAVSPEIMYIPYAGDVHTDHRVVFDAAMSCSKWFRFQSVQRVLCYEVISETDFGFQPDTHGFRPNVFVDIGKYMEEKIQILRTYASELADFPFPRSEQAVRALANVRGAAAGCSCAEAFMLLKEII